MSVKETLKQRREQEAAQREAAEKTAMALALAEAGIENEVESEKESEMSNMIETVDVVNTVSNGRRVSGSVQVVKSVNGPQSTTASVMETSDLRTSEAEVAIILAERGYRNYVEVVASLDLVNPQLVILDGTTNASNIAMSWAKSRGRQFRVMVPDWGDGPAQNPVAGIERNREVVKFAKQLVKDHGDRVVVLTFRTGDRDDNGRLATFDTAVASFFNVLDESNATLQAADVKYHKYRIPYIFVSEWLTQDAICADAMIEVVEGEWIPIPEPKARIGTREVVTNNPSW